MILERLAWDSDFFGYEVAKATQFSGSEEEQTLLALSPYHLIYLFLEQPLDIVPQGYFFADEKTILQRDLKQEEIFASHSTVVSLPEPNDQLVVLALQSGIYSRFRVDPNFVHGEFERIYAKWIENSFVEETHSKVLAYKEGENLLGFTSISRKNSLIDIGLIAVDFKARGKGVGSILIEEVMQVARQLHLNKVTVTTQGANKEAMEFYKKNKFEIIDRKYIYHIWK